MKILIVFILTALSFNAFAQLNMETKLPKAWATDFVITLSYSGSRGGSTKISFTHDLVTYVESPGTKGPRTKTYKLKEADRTTILNKLKELNLDQIQVGTERLTVMDGWSQSICFADRCIEGGPSVTMDEKNKNMFLDAYRYLEEFAIKKTK